MATGQPSLTQSTPIKAEAKPLTEPTERSISPTIRMQTMPSAMMPTVEQSNSRLTRLLLARKTGLSASNTVQMIASPTTTGSEPRSPARTRSRKPRSQPPSPASSRTRISPRSSSARRGRGLADAAAHGRISSAPLACRRAERRDTALSAAPVIAPTSSSFDASG